MRFFRWVVPRRTGNLPPGRFFRGIRGAVVGVVVYPVVGHFRIYKAAGIGFGPAVGLCFPVVAGFSVGVVVAVGGSDAVASVLPVSGAFFVPSVTAMHDAAGVGVPSPISAAFAVPVVTIGAIASVSPVSSSFSLPAVSAFGLGPELIVNGAFTSNANGWTLANMIWSGGRVETDFAGIPLSIIQNSTSFSSANTYRVSINFVARNGTTWVQFNLVNSQQVTSTGVQFWDLVPPSTGLFKINGTGGTANLTVDDISIRQKL